MKMRVECEFDSAEDALHILTAVAQVVADKAQRGGDPAVVVDATPKAKPRPVVEQPQPVASAPPPPASSDADPLSDIAAFQRATSLREVMQEIVARKLTDGLPRKDAEAKVVALVGDLKKRGVPILSSITNLTDERIVRAFTIASPAA